MSDYVSRFYHRHEDRIKNFARSWALSYSAGLGFRLFVNYCVAHNGQLSTALVQMDELLRGPIGYGGTLFLNWLLKKYGNENRYLPKVLAMAISATFEFAQHKSVIPNEILGAMYLGAYSTLDGSIEDEVMDLATVASVDLKTKDAKKNSD
jgi:hypothetical protein